MIGESRSSPHSGAMSAAEVERELARLRMNEDGTLGARASVLNLIVVTDEESAASVMRVVSELSGRYPSRVILIISDPDEEEANLEVSLSAFCGLRRGMPGGSQVCAERVTIHVEGPPARHLESLAGPLLIPDLPVFLWYPNDEVPRSMECEGMASLADRLILDSGIADDCEASLQAVAYFLEGEGVPAVGDLQWTALSPWRSLVADLFAPPERAGELLGIQRAEILHGRVGECQALLLIGWLSNALGWRPESVSRTEEGRTFRFTGSSGDVAVRLALASPDAALGCICLFSEEFTFRVQVSYRGGRIDACSTVTRGDEFVGERTANLGSSGLGALLGEEFGCPGRDETYECALRRAVEMLKI